MSKVTKPLPVARLLSRREVETILGPTRFKDALQAGWIKPRARKKGAGQQTDTYALSDVRDVEDRILNGEYPGQA
jgi:hypothetical protein